MRTELYWIEGPWPGRLAIAPRPRGGDWLEDEIASWHSVGIDAVVSALTREENEELDLIQEKKQCEKTRIEFMAFPIEDRGVPPSAKACQPLVRHLERRLMEGKQIVVHCRQGVGRSALLAACVLALSGLDPSSAFERIETARGCSVPDTSEQREWVARFAKEKLTSPPQSGGTRSRTR